MGPNVYSPEYYQKNSKKMNESAKKNYQKNRKKIIEKNKIYKEQHKEENREKTNAYMRQYKTRLKIQVITHYSKDSMKCACCGESMFQCLTLDHIKGGGLAEKRKLGLKTDSAAFYSYLIKNHFPKGYQVYCQNCNLAKGTKADCPHKQLLS